MANQLLIRKEYDAPFDIRAALTATGGSWVYSGGAYTVTGSSAANDTITLDTDLTTTFTAGRHFVVSGSTGGALDGTYTVVSAEVVADDTVITVSEDVTSDIGDGTANIVYQYSFLVVAWDTPDEADIQFARYMTYAYGEANAYYSVYDALEVGTGDNDKVTISWAAPRVMPDHYAVYCQVASSYDLAATGTKLLPASGLVRGNIPAYATSAVLPNQTAVTYSRQVPITVDTDNEYYYVPGNRICSLYSGATIAINNGGGNQTISGVRVERRGTGETTRVTVSAATAGATYMTFSEGPIAVPTSAQDDYILIDYPDMQVAERESSGISIHGHAYKKSYIASGPVAGMRITWPISPTYADFVGGNITSGNDARDALYYLHKWRAAGTRLEFQISQDSGVNQYHEYFYASLEEIPSMGMKDMQDESELAISVKINGETINRHNYLWLSMTAKSNASDTVSVDGDWTNTLVAGTKIRIANATADNGLHAVVSSTYTSSKTVITLNAVTDETVDGHIEVWSRR